MEGTKLDLKLQFENPSFISLSTQNELDSIVFKYPKDVVLTDIDGNGLVLDNADDGGDALDVGVPLQPQIEEDTPE